MMSGWNAKWSQNIENMLSKGRRNSAADIINRLRSGSLPGWVGGSPNFPQSDIACTSYSSGDPTQSTCTTATSSSAVKSPAMLHHLEPEPEDDDKDALMSKELNVVADLNQSLYPRHINAINRPSSNTSSPSRKHQFTIVPMKVSDETDRNLSKRQGNEALGLVLSALYGKLLVVMGIAFPMSEVISTYIPPSFYDGFYLYLYFGSITFMICIYGNILRQKATQSVRCTLQRINTMRTRLTSTNSGVAPDVTSNDPTDRVSCDSEGSFSESPLPSPTSPALGRRQNMPSIINGNENEHHIGSESAECQNTYAGAYAVQRIHFGSFYLRMGAVAFGIGSMIYSGLEFGQYFELDPDTKCHNFMIALTPAVRMIFTFMQMYFIFLNSKMAVSKVRLGAQFGLMHMIGTNLCVWLNVLVQETRHEILSFYNPDNGTITYPGSNQFLHPKAPSSAISNTNTYGHHGHGTVFSVDHISTTTVNSTLLNVASTVATILTGNENVHHREKRGLKGPYSIYECRRSDIMGSLVQNASPFLFPCTIEYSLICAAILYVMWKSMAKRRAAMNRSRHDHHHHGDGSHMCTGPKRSPHHYSVDCARANKGLFLGIFVLVMTIISLILFFVLINRPTYQALATLEVNITELVLYTTTTVAVLIGMCQMRELRYVRGRNLELDNILLIVAQTGSFIYNVFTIIGGHFTMKKHTVLVLMTALSSLIQLLFQTLFILDASKRSASTTEQARRKPGREVVTFLLVTNLAMWAINTLEKSRADSHPVQLKFYGVWAWTIITHISMPLAIFYRFHSTVCLCEIWKRAYKMKPSICH